MLAFYITWALREVARKQYYLHFGSSLLEFKIYGALPPFLVFNYITFAMDCAASANTAAGYDCGRASSSSGNL